MKGVYWNMPFGTWWKLGWGNERIKIQLCYKKYSNYSKWRQILIFLQGVQLLRCSLILGRGYGYGKVPQRALLHRSPNERDWYPKYRATREAFRSDMVDKTIIHYIIKNSYKFPNGTDLICNRIPLEHQSLMGILYIHLPSLFYVFLAFLLFSLVFLF